MQSKGRCRASRVVPIAKTSLHGRERMAKVEDELVLASLAELQQQRALAVRAEHRRARLGWVLVRQERRAELHF